MRRGYRRVSRGSVFLLAMVSLVCLLFLGTSLVQVAIHGLSFASEQQKRAQALGMAEAGVELALTKLYDNYELANDELEEHGTYSDSFALGDGTVDYVVTAPYPGIPNSCTVLSTATTRTHQSETVRVVVRYLIDVSRVFEGAIFSDSDLTLEGGGAVYPDATGAGGVIYARGDVEFTTQGNESFEMASTGEIYCTGTTSFVPTAVPPENVHENIAPLPMPEIDIDYYRNAVLNEGKGTYFDPHGHSLNLPETAGNLLDLNTYGSIIFVEGDVNVSGRYTGSAVVVATGTITVTGLLKPADGAEGAAIGLISPKAVKVQGGTSAEIWGLIYSHGLDVDASIELGGGLTIHGAVVADAVRGKGSMTVYYERVWPGLDVPGKGKSQFIQISWEELLNS